MKIKIKKTFNLWDILLAIILLLAFFVRVYRLNHILGFYFDQGRDALVIWDLWHKGKLFLIGPVTGIVGIFRGPFYYYLIAPFYLIGRGNPVFPSVFLAVTSVTALYLLYFLGKKIQGKEAGFFALIIGSFSFYIIMASRWLSNPTPMLLLSMILVWMMLLVLEGKKWAWVVISAVLGISFFHFGSSGEIFYFPAVLVFAIWQYKNLPSLRIFLFSMVVFLLTLAPLVIFDFKHEHILSGNVQKSMVQEKSFQSFTKIIVKDRFELYYDIFTNKIFDYRSKREVVTLLIVALGFILLLPRIFKSKIGVIPTILLLAPIIGFLFFRANDQFIYDYYFTGYYLIFILVFSVVLGYIWKNLIGKIFVIYFFYLFFSANAPIVFSKLQDRIDGPEAIYLGNQKQAIDWIYEDAEGQEFNVDVYVPPVIPHAYDYLFKWYGSGEFGYEPVEENIELLYTLYEVDPPHPERLEAWLARQKGIGEIEKQDKFGGITVERRKRI